MTTPDLDLEAVQAFAGRLQQDLAGAATTSMVVAGDRLGLYRALAAAGPVTADKLAAQTGLNPRLVREWLAVQAVASYVRYDPAAGTYELPAEHAMVLSVPESPAYLVGAAEIVAGQFLILDRLEAAMRGDGGIGYGEYPHSVHHGIERFFHTAYRHQLAQVWVPAVDGLTALLEAGARVADIGCGHGAATLLMAQAWPASSFDGFDFHAPSVVTARARAVEAGNPPNVTFQVGDATAAGTLGAYDVVFFFDALHDLGDPLAALVHARSLLRPGGILVAVEPWSVDRLEDGIGNPQLVLAYGSSVSLCTPNSLAQPGAYGLGTAGGPAHRVRLLEEAGFADARVAADTGFNLVLAATR
ncbi:class I SAM-dependent methyltransferase [Dactylosporangium sp. NPDC005572]|uniref:class I SAM-dependent methyltransferase n=1 Tax=Dactylosporangium sp. NPDC005572 TaxID=3156889 RepID=UPI0033B80480